MVNADKIRSDQAVKGILDIRSTKQRVSEPIKADFIEDMIWADHKYGYKVR